MTAGFGAFGKLPAMGDFLRLTLPAEVVQPWDAWLQDTLPAARASLGERWSDAYMSAPIWRFTLPAGQAGPRPLLGVLMASVDRVGRQFPLTLAAPLAPVPASLAHFANDALFARLEEIALAALEDDMTRDRLSEALAALIPPAPVAGDIAPHRYRGALPPQAALAAEAILRAEGDVALWSMASPDEHRLLTCAHLPDAATLASVFDLDAGVWAAGPKAIPA